MTVAAQGGSGVAFLRFPADVGGTFPGGVRRVNVSVVSSVPASVSPVPRSSSASADRSSRAGVRNLTVNAGSTEHTRVTVALPAGFSMPGHGSCASSSGSERDCVVTLTGGGSGTRQLAAGTEVAAGTHAISVAVNTRPGRPALVEVRVPAPGAVTPHYALLGAPRDVPGDSIAAAVTLSLSRELGEDETRPTVSIESAPELWDMVRANAPKSLGACSPACEIAPDADTYTVGVSISAPATITVDGTPVQISPRGEVTWYFPQTVTVRRGETAGVPITAHAPPGVAAPASVTLEALPHTYFLPGHPDPDCDGTNAGPAFCTVALDNGVATVAVEGFAVGDSRMTVQEAGVFPGNAWVSVPVVGAPPVSPGSSGSADVVVVGGDAGTLAPGGVATAETRDVRGALQRRA